MVNKLEAKQAGKYIRLQSVQSSMSPRCVDSSKSELIPASPS